MNVGSHDKDNKALSQMMITFIFLGILATILAVLFFAAPTPLFESMAIFTIKGIDVLVGFGNTGFSAFMAAFFFWIVFLSVLGFPWARVLLAKSEIVEQIIFAIVFGFFVMGSNILIAGSAASIYMLIGAGSTYTLDITDKITNALIGNQEQSYAILNVLIWFVAGIMVLIAKEIIMTARKK